MNTRLLTFSLIALLGLGSMGASGSIPPGQQKKLLDQQHQALVQEELTLAQTYRQLMDQKRALLEQLRALNRQGGTTQDWENLWEDYHVATVEDNKTEHKIDKGKLKALRPTNVDKDAFKSSVEALLDAMEANQQQLDATAESLVENNQKKQKLNNDEKNFNQQNGKK